MIYFSQWTLYHEEGEAIKEVHYQTYIIKHQRWFSEVTLRYVRAIWEVWVYNICILRITSSTISTSSTSSQITSYINSYHFTQHWCIAYVDWISDYTSSTIHIHITLLQHITCTKFATGDPICTGIPSQKIQYCWHVIAGLLHIL